MKLSLFPLLYMGGAGLGATIFTVALITAIFVGIFLLIRSVMLWYWKVDTIVSNQSHQSELLKYQNQLLGKQNELLTQLIKQTGNNPTDPNAEPLRG